MHQPCNINSFFNLRNLKRIFNFFEFNDSFNQSQTGIGFHFRWFISEQLSEFNHHFATIRR